MLNHENESENQSRLRSRLRNRAAAGQYVHCDIVCVWVTGSIQPRFQFQAKVTTRPSRLRTAAYSPTFPATKPIMPTTEARDALAMLISQLLDDGWEGIETTDQKHWYSRSFRRERTYRRDDPLENDDAA